MSWEGYQQILCKNGHHNSTDAGVNAKDWSCPDCKEKCAWYNIVDTTNGSYDGEERIDGYVELKEKTKAINCTCEKCGNLQ